MKKTLLLVLLFLASFSSFGQKIRFSDSTNKWLCWLLALQLAPPIIEPDTFTYSGTMVLNGMTYLKLIQNSNYCIGYFREDTTSKKVFIITLPLIDSNEYVLYDYTLQVGDTFKYPNTVSHYVSAIDSVTINGQWYKTWHLVPTKDTTLGYGVQNDYDVIEGIGSIQFPLFPSNPTTFESSFVLTCFSNNNTTSPVNPKVGRIFNNTSSCDLTFGLKTTNMTLQSNKPLVNPNPITESSKIQLPYSIPSGSLTITNTLGQITAQIAFQNKQELPIGDLIKAPGVYFYRVTDNSIGETYSGKFVY